MNWRAYKTIAVIIIFIVFCFIISAVKSSAGEETVEVMVLYKDEVPQNENSLKISSKNSKQDELPIQKITVPISEVEKLKKDPDVEAISTRKPLKLYETVTLSNNRPKDEDLFNLKLINTYEAWDHGYTGEGVKIAIIDSGFANHRDLKLAGGVSFIAREPYTSDGTGHGTHVAGIINAQRNGEGVAGVSPDAQVYGLKVFNNRGNGSSFELIEALEWAIENDMDIVNMSLGLDADDPVLRATIRRAVQKGMLLVAASGNENGGPVSYPARYDGVIAVASVDQNKNHSKFSNIGSENDLSAPGEYICSTVPNNGYECWNGTSMATPHVTGLLALLKERFPNYSASTLIKYITESAEDLGAPGHDEVFGYGLAKYVEPTLSIHNSNITVDTNTITMKMDNLEQNAIYSIYNDAQLKNKIYSFTAVGKTKTIRLQEIGYFDRSIYVTVKKAGYGESEPIKVDINVERLSSLKAENVKVINNYEADDVIELTGLTKGNIYTIYSDKNLRNTIKTFTATGSTYKFTIPQIGAKAGSIYVVVSKEGVLPSFPTEVPFLAEQLPPLKAENITVINNYGANDSIAFKGLTKGNTYTIYSDANLKKTLAAFTATNTVQKVTVSLGYKAGNIYVVVSKDGYRSSEKTAVSYKAEQLPSIKAANVSIINNYHAYDKITLKGLIVGVQYTVYSNAGLTKSLISFKATNTTQTVSVPQIGAKAGAVYIVASKTGYLPSAVTKVSFKAEKLPALSSKNVTVTNNIKNDKIAFKGLTKGWTYTIYSDSHLKKKLKSFTATSTTKTITVSQVGAKAGSVYIVVSKSGYLSSSATKVNFKGEPTPAISAKHVKVTNKKNGDTITFSNLKKGATIVIYKDAKKTKKLASFKATQSTKTLKVKQLGKKAGKIFITVQLPGYSVSATTTISYPKER